MSYNTDLQNNNTNLQNVLAKVNTLPSKDAVEIKKWIFTLEDDSTVEKYVEVPKEVHTITYDLDDGITSSNTITEISHGSSYSTTITAADGFVIWFANLTMNGEEVMDLYWDDIDPRTSTISIDHVTGDIEIFVRITL